jgi:hypothetical protein
LEILQKLKYYKNLKIKSTITQISFPISHFSNPISQLNQF